MPKVGDMGLDMMLRTCTIQVNLDFCSELDMIKKFKTSLSLQPIISALFSNSPFVEGKFSGFLSNRVKFGEIQIKKDAVFPNAYLKKTLAMRNGSIMF